MLFEDLKVIGIDISLKFILECELTILFEVCLRYADVIINHKDVSIDRKRVYNDIKKRAYD